MGYLEKRFAALIAWAETKGPDGQIAAALLRTTWRDVEGNISPDDLDTEELELLEGSQCEEKPKS